MWITRISEDYSIYILAFFFFFFAAQESVYYLQKKKKKMQFAPKHKLRLIILC